jgi:hypothetical protein
MPYKIKLTVVAALLLAGSALLWTCSTPNSQAPFDADAQKHAAGWVPQDHRTAVENNGALSCKECHGEDLSGGIVKVSCTTCHLGGPLSVHPAAWEDNADLNHRDYVLLGPTITKFCANAACHGSDFKGVTGSGPSCTSCHAETFYDCSSCHAFPPNTGKHVFHMQQINFVCTNCHALAWQTHDNGTVDIASSVTYSFTARSCTPSNTSTCHETRFWP